MYARLVSDTSIEGAEDNLCTVLDDEGVSYTPVRQEAIFIKDADGKLLKADLVVPETETGLQGFINLKDYKTNKPLNIPKDGVIISRSYEKHHDIHIGDTISLLDMNGVGHESRVVAVSEHYLSGCQIVMSRSYYEKMMAKDMVSNTVFLNYGDKDPHMIYGVYGKLRQIVYGDLPDVRTERKLHSIRKEKKCPLFRRKTFERSKDCCRIRCLYNPHFRADRCNHSCIFPYFY